MNDIQIPYVRMEQIKKFILELPKETSTIDELFAKFGRSNVINALPALTLLQLIEYNKKEKKVFLTERGRKFRTALITEKYKKAREIMKNIVDEIELFIFVRGLLERKGFLTIEEIGKEIAFKYDKTWRNPATYRAYGSACASILSFVGYGVYEKGVLRKDRISFEKERKLPSPYLSLNKMIKILKEIGNDEADLHILSKRLSTHEKRLGAELSVCVELGIIERIVPGKFILTKKGEKLIDPLNVHRIREIWKEILLESRYIKIVRLLFNREFDFKELGDILQHHFGGKWKEKTTIDTFTKKFLNWLKDADIIEEKEGGKYGLVEIKLPKEQVNKSFSSGFARGDYYCIGKYVGIVSSSTNFNEINKTVSDLINICKQDNALADVTELLEQHLKLFKEMKLSDGRVFLPDINLLEKRLGLGDKK